ncbi:MAG: hypothetical protein CL930_15270 [Deltaproteobacteria bacterium]|nr:hypothetical protein [Deltaproteobacteria bacterium]
MKCNDLHDAALSVWVISMVGTIARWFCPSQEEGFGSWIRQESSAEKCRLVHVAMLHQSNKMH